MVNVLLIGLIACLANRLSYLDVLFRSGRCLSNLLGPSFKNLSSELENYIVLSAFHHFRFVPNNDSHRQPRSSHEIDVLADRSETAVINNNKY